MGNYHGRIVWYELMTTYMKTAKLFYANVVGWGARDASAPALGYRRFGAKPAKTLSMIRRRARWRCLRLSSRPNMAPCGSVQ